MTRNPMFQKFLSNQAEAILICTFWCSTVGFDVDFRTRVRFMSCTIFGLQFCISGIWIPIFNLEAKNGEIHQSDTIFKIYAKSYPRQQKLTLKGTCSVPNEIFEILPGKPGCCVCVFLGSYQEILFLSGKDEILHETF